MSMRRFADAIADYGPCNRVVAEAVAGRCAAWLSIASCTPNESGRRLAGFDDLVVGIFDTNHPFDMRRDRGDGMERLRIRPGMVYAIPWDCERFVAWNGTYRFRSLAIPRDWIARFVAEADIGDETTVLESAHLAADDPVVAVLVRKLVDDLTRGGVASAGDDLYCDQAAGLVVAALLRTRGRQRRAIADPMPWRVRRALDYVDARLPAPVTLDGMAAAAGLSRFHFCRVFRAATGSSPHDHVLSVKLARASDRLLSSRDTVADVARACGFASPSRFGALFRARYGATPSAWRNAGR
jgi:AraC family transcriptional regulator